MKYLTESWDGSEFPLAYLITIRTYGTRLHGDRRSVDRHRGANRYGSPRSERKKNTEDVWKKNADSPAFVLSKPQRVVVDLSIRETCKIRGFDLLALDVRTNHLHSVVSANRDPELIISCFKRYAARKLRRYCLVQKDDKIWSRGGSRRFLWRMRKVDQAIDYVLYGQGDIDFE